MKIEDIEIRVEKRTKAVYSDIFTGEMRLITDSVLKSTLKALRHIYCKRTMSDAVKRNYYLLTMDEIEKLIVKGEIKLDDNLNDEKIINDEIKCDIDIKKRVAKNLIDFFSEFSFEPNFRFVNTLFWQVKNNTATQYIANYFSLSDNQNCNAIIEKIKCDEFKLILDDIKQINCEKKINSRLKIYYGSQGTGKTTMAINESDGTCMVCHSAMLPSDLMEDFKFENGNPSFNPSSLQLAMINGTKITLDEINLLPYESLRFLQSILDGKSEFIYKGKTIHIKDGFQIIGTMNLVVNGCTFSLPEPLIDRATDLQKYTLDANTLVGAFE